MTTRVELDDALVNAAVLASGQTGIRETVELALTEMIENHRRRAALAEIAGTGWVGDLDVLRRGADAAE